TSFCSSRRAAAAGESGEDYSRTSGSLPIRVPVASQTSGSTVSLVKRRLPSHIKMFTPPGWKLLAGETSCHQSLFGRQQGLLGGSKWLYQFRQMFPSFHG